MSCFYHSFLWQFFFKSLWCNFLDSVNKIIFQKLCDAIISWSLSSELLPWNNVSFWIADPLHEDRICWPSKNIVGSKEGKKKAKIWRQQLTSDNSRFYLTFLESGKLLIKQSEGYQTPSMYVTFKRERARERDNVCFPFRID